MSKKTIGATLAATAAVVFSIAPIVSSYAATNNEQVQCFGVNACKGQSACKTASNSCAGHNSCKGQGVVMKTASDCTKEGGKTSQT